MSSQSPSLPPAIIEQFKELGIGTYIVAAAGVALIYDYLLTLPDEIQYVWPKALSVPTALFYVNRYIPLPMMILGLHHLSPFHGPETKHFCQRVLLAQPLAESLSWLAGSWLLLLRVMALYGHKKPLYIFLLIVFVATHVATGYYMGRAMTAIYPTIIYLPANKICAGDHWEKLAGAYFSMIPFEVILIILQFYHTGTHRHLLSGVGTKKASLFRSIIIDGSLYFVVVFCVRMIAGIIYALEKRTFYIAATWIEFAFSALSVSRLFLHLRSIAGGDAHENGWSLGPSSMSASTGRIPSRPGMSNMIKANTTDLSSFLSF